MEVQANTYTCSTTGSFNFMETGMDKPSEGLHWPVAF